MDPVDHLDGESVGGGHRGGRLLGRIAREACTARTGWSASRSASRSACARPSSSSGAPGGRLSRTRAALAMVRPCLTSTSLIQRRPRTQPGQPALARRRTPRRRSRVRGRPRADARRRAVRGRRRGIGAEEAHPVAAPVQRGERLAHRRLGDVAGAVEVEPVLRVPVLDRARLDAREVDAAHRQLGEQPQQRAGAVLGGGGERRPVAAGGRGRRAGRGEEHEAGDGTGVVGDVVGEDLQAEQRGGDRRAHGGVDLAARHLRRRLAGRGADQDVRVRQVAGDPVAGLRDPVVVRGDGADLGQRGAGRTIAANRTAGPPP